MFPELGGSKLPNVLRFNALWKFQIFLSMISTIPVTKDRELGYTKSKLYTHTLKQVSMPERGCC